MAVTLMLTRPVTDEELVELARLNPGYQLERDPRGELIVTPTGSRSGHRESRLIAQLDHWAEQHGRGLTFSSSTLFRLPDGSRYMPDASWLAQERWDALPESEREGFAAICPDAVFEIASPGNRPGELQDKMRTYLANGARLGVLIDPVSRTVEIYRSGQESRALADPEIVTLDPELPGFTLELAPIFDA